MSLRKQITGKRRHMLPESSVDSHHAEETALYIINWSEETWKHMNRGCTEGDQFDLLHNYQISMKSLQTNPSRKSYKEELQIWQQRFLQLFREKRNATLPQTKSLRNAYRLGWVNANGTTQDFQKY